MQVTVCGHPCRPVWFQSSHLYPLPLLFFAFSGSPFFLCLKTIISFLFKYPPIERVFSDRCWIEDKIFPTSETFFESSYNQRSNSWWCPRTGACWTLVPIVPLGNGILHWPVSLHLSSECKEKSIFSFNLNWIFQLVRALQNEVYSPSVILKGKICN